MCVGVDMLIDICCASLKPFKVEAFRKRLLTTNGHGKQEKNVSPSASPPSLCIEESSDPESVCNISYSANTSPTPSPQMLPRHSPCVHSGDAHSDTRPHVACTTCEDWSEASGEHCDGVLAGMEQECSNRSSSSTEEEERGRDSSSSCATAAVDGNGGYNDVWRMRDNLSGTLRSSMSTSQTHLSRSGVDGGTLHQLPNRLHSQSQQQQQQWWWRWREAWMRPSGSMWLHNPLQLCTSTHLINILILLL